MDFFSGRITVKGKNSVPLSSKSVFFVPTSGSKSQSGVYNRAIPGGAGRRLCERSFSKFAKPGDRGLDVFLVPTSGSKLQSGVYNRAIPVGTRRRLCVRRFSKFAK